MTFTNKSQELKSLLVYSFYATPTLLPSIFKAELRARVFMVLEAHDRDETVNIFTY